MRDLVALGAMFFFVPLAFMNPFSAYLLWGWGGLIALNFYLFGFMSGVPYVFLFALITLAPVLFRKGVIRQPFEPNRTAVLMILFVVHGFVCAALAYPGLERNWELWGNVAKTALFCLLMPMLANDRFRIHAIVVVMALALSFHGVLDGLKFIASAGAHNAQSNPKFGDNNHLSLILLMALPVIYYLQHYAAKRLARWSFLGALVLTLLAVMATHSRAGLIGLFVVGVAVVLRTRRRWSALTAVILATVLITEVAPDDWTTRMQTIQLADQDASFMGRVAAWKVSSAIAVAHPFVGGGFRALQSFPVWDQFRLEQGLLGFIDTPVLNRSGVAAHSIWFEVMGDMGFVGLFLFLALLINAFLTQRQIWKLVRANGDKQRWAGDLADMLGISLLAFVVTGSTLSAAYFELPYVCMMLLEVIKQQQRRLSHATHQRL
ncbi:putative O-glycosylation ligase, exosortase A system-associated [Rhodococcus sp. SRB_17]|uniref:putative O-glycosylation ligase, exosortase A system-associated n=1 Tax=Acidovorax sp. SRB_24 TaxID=1962700 RepID=UPI00145C8E87|nr:putative O-glycosylation ligase, exosortase A system-associated [Acidovorax sp. SRB_24]NMM75426.1 putative O-glycosylation ligase, exosortase A system-associated [Acidovorax sp. SRB_24]NMM86713.1 putative O-glycosylation ligase, exosortase A system-associated [Rhodococcus sp. SRB_17]